MAIRITPFATMNQRTVAVNDTLDFSHATETAQFILKQLPMGLQKPRLGVICGSGLGGLADTVLSYPRHDVSYSAIPYFPTSSGTAD